MPLAQLTVRLRRALRRDLLITLAPAALVAAAFGLAYHFVEPAPPKTVVIAVSQGEGGFRWYARRYKEVLARDGVTLEVRDSSGADESVALLASEDSGVHVAFVQGGTAPKEGESRVVSLGSLSYVPLWVFYRGERIDDVAGLRGRRVAVGPPQGGSHALAVQLLEAAGAEGAATELLPLERREATEALQAGEIDAMVLLSPAEAPMIRRLAAMPDIQLLSSARAEAYTRRFPYLSRLVLPRGVLDLAADVPREDVALVSPTAKLLARDTLHPALAYLLMRAASEVHGGAGLLDRAGEFPAPYGGDFELSEQARRYYKSGAPFLQRYLPFWAANLVDRLWVMVVPTLAVLIPLLRVIPPLYRWRVRSRIYRWYARLKEVELQLDENPGQVTLEEMLQRMEEIDSAVNHIPTPLSYSENLYSFRQHIELVRRRIIERLQSEKIAAERTRLAG